MFQEAPDDAADFQKFVVVGPFAEVGSAQLRALAPVLERIGRGNHDDRQLVEALAGANAAEYSEAIDTGKIEIEKHGVERRGVRIFLRPFDGGDRHFAIDGGLNVEIEAFELNGFADEQSVGKVVFNHQYGQRPHQRPVRRVGGR